MGPARLFLLRGPGKHFQQVDRRVHFRRPGRPVHSGAVVGLLQQQQQQQQQPSNDGHILFPCLQLHPSKRVHHHALLKLPTEPIAMTPPAEAVMVVKKEDSLLQQQQDEAMSPASSNGGDPPGFYSTNRVRTKEETDAAHDLLELSRSLPPPMPSLQQVGPHYPPTPPTPDEQPFNHYTTLIYVNPGSGNNNNNLDLGCSSSINEFPLTPPTEHSSSDSTSSMEMESALTIADGRTKKNRGEAAEGTDSFKDKLKYVCTECGKNYATSSNLSRHKQTHRSLDSNNAKKCHICHKMYVSMPALSMHILTHNLNHRCDVCGKAFSRPWLLQGHLRSHTGHKPYSCNVCKKSFADRSNLRAHMQTHSTSKNFQCSRCHKTFALKSYLNKHYESACVRGDSPC